MTSILQLTAHAATRMAQRGIASRNLELITRIGTAVEGGYLVRQKDFQALDRELKQLRQRARKLVGKRFVVECGRVVTAYHTGRRTERRLLRAAEDRSVTE
ncbi:hypothetical protein [Methylocystis hirsuta]|uniref:DUF4258 domain-containing protein n=1 Tax=Methylocystis hirsuta TaxID=369798 RepID=A0A3M9XRR3_9HYPH|nr:hypothetical protein [Methylocystis hirsuta]RNJ50933.1 hypothetical protein D1O30_16430 [Methylocystis hirsuta]